MNSWFLNVSSRQWRWLSLQTSWRLGQVKLSCRGRELQLRARGGVLNLDLLPLSFFNSDRQLLHLLTEFSYPTVG
jgi:hypothetical protein